MSTSSIPSQCFLVLPSILYPHGSPAVQWAQVGLGYVVMITLLRWRPRGPLMAEHCGNDGFTCLSVVTTNFIFPSLPSLPLLQFQANLDLSSRKEGKSC